MAGHILLETLHNIGLVVLPFTIYFFWKKIGQKISASYSWRSEFLVASGIGTITLINLKDRPVVIFSAHAVMDKFWFNLKKFNPPLILKSMEAVNIESDIVSKYEIDNEILEWKDPLDKKRPITIYLSTSHNTIRCHRHQNPYIRELTYPRKHKLRIVKNYTRRFGDIIYNDDAKYALIYTQDNKRKTALIDRSGMICGASGANQWDYSLNAIAVSDLQNTDTVRAAIASSDLANIISPFYVQSLSP